MLSLKFEICNTNSTSLYSKEDHIFQGARSLYGNICSSTRAKMTGTEMILQKWWMMLKVTETRLCAHAAGRMDRWTESYVHCCKLYWHRSYESSARIPTEFVSNLQCHSSRISYCSGYAFSGAKWYLSAPAFKFAPLGKGGNPSFPKVSNAPPLPLLK